MYAYGYAHDETAEQGEEKKVSNIVICIVVYKYSSLYLNIYSLIYNNKDSVIADNIYSLLYLNTYSCIVVNMTIQLYVLLTI